MANYDLLASLIPLLSQFEKEKKGADSGSIELFAGWLHDRTIMDKKMKDKRLEESQDTGQPRGEDLRVTLGKLVYYMYRYAKFYTKKALKNHVLNSLDEFTFLVTLLNLPPLTKTELIAKMVYDKTSGMEIINRFIKSGLIAELDNPADKRSKLISITDAGRGVLFSSFEELGKVSQIIPGNLRPEELMMLITLLDKLDHHHLDIWNNMRDHDLDTILAQKHPEGK